MRSCLALVVAAMAAVLVVGSISNAHADERPGSRFGLVVGAGVGGTRTAAQLDASDQHGLVGTFQLDVGYRVHARAMVGLHLGIATAAQLEDVDVGSMSTTSTDSSYLPVQLGVTAHYAVGSAFAAPWVGVQRGWRRLGCRAVEYHGMPGRPDTKSCDEPERDWESVRVTALAIGATFGADVLVRGEHRVTVTASLSHARDHYDYWESYTSFSLGVGYRFWAP